jgi:hypothetical protein
LTVTPWLTEPRADSVNEAGAASTAQAVELASMIARTAKSPTSLILM